MGQVNTITVTNPLRHHVFGVGIPNTFSSSALIANGEPSAGQGSCVVKTRSLVAANLIRIVPLADNPNGFVFGDKMRVVGWSLIGGSEDVAPTPLAEFGVVRSTSPAMWDIGSGQWNPPVALNAIDGYKKTSTMSPGYADTSVQDAASVLVDMAG